MNQEMIVENQKKLYIDNELFYNEMCKYLEACALAEADGKEIPSPNDYIGSCFIKIAEKFVNHRYFSGYTYRDELIGDAIVNCMVAIRNFDPTKSKNPFAYFSQITYFAFRRRCIKELAEQEKKYQLLDGYDVDSLVCDNNDNDELVTFITESARKQLDLNPKTTYNTKKEKKQKVKPIGPTLFDD